MSGLRGTRILRESGKADIHTRLQGEGVQLGEVFTYVSGLYFRGKLAYATSFGVASAAGAGAYIITPCGGLVSPETNVNIAKLRSICSADVDASNPRYCKPVEDDVRRLRDQWSDSRFVLLGSIATPKYIEPLMRVLDGRLFYPAEFIGRGDMSRGALLLECVKRRVELDYVDARSAARHGKRPPKPRSAC